MSPGLEKLLSGGTVDELARTVRKQVAGKAPTVQIPVRIEHCDRSARGDLGRRSPPRRDHALEGGRRGEPLTIGVKVGKLAITEHRAVPAASPNQSGPGLST